MNKKETSKTIALLVPPNSSMKYHLPTLHSVDEDSIHLIHIKVKLKIDFFEKKLNQKLRKI